jgi:hypothetical protein
MTDLTRTWIAVVVGEDTRCWSGTTLLGPDDDRVLTAGVRLGP